MSIHTGRIGTPPQKSPWHIGRDTLLPLTIIIVLALIAIVLIGLGLQRMNAVDTPRTMTGQPSFYTQRVEEWNAGQLALTPAQRSLHEQRLGEWTTGQTQPVSVPQMRLNSGWESQMAQARNMGVR